MAREQWDIQATDPGASSPSILAAAAQSFQGRPIFHCPVFPGGSDSKESACNVGDLGSIPGLGRAPGEGNSCQYSGLENPMDYTVHRILKGQNTGVGSLSLLQQIFPTQGLNPGLLHCRWILYQLSHQGSPQLRKPLP